MRWACLTLMLLPLAAEDADPPPRPASPMAPPERVALPEDGLTVSLVPGTRLPMVEVHVGEAGPFRFVVEWAGNVLAVSDRVRRAAELETCGRSPHGNDLVRVPQLTIGEASFEGLVADVPPFFAHTDHDGALGLNVFRELVGTLDFPAAKLHLSRSGLPSPDDDPTVVAYSPGPGGSPRVPITIANKTFEAVLDTAAERTLILDERYLETLELAGELREGPRIMTPDMGELTTREAHLAGTLVVGVERRETPFALFHRMRQPEVLLGGGFLRGYALTLDQKNRRLRLTRPAPESSPDATEDQAEASGSQPGQRAQ